MPSLYRFELGTRTCALPGCENEFAARSSTHRFCSEECKRLAKWGKRVCRTCGGEFIPESPRQMFCCRDHYRRFMRRVASRAALSREFHTEPIRWNGVPTMILPPKALDKWGFKRDPFSDDPKDFSELFWSRSHTAVRDYIIDGINRVHVRAVSAPVGYGKSFIWLYVADQLRQQQQMGYEIINVHSVDKKGVCANTLLRAIATDLGEATPKFFEPEAFSREIGEILVLRARERKRIVLVVDEAHRIHPDALRAIKVLRDIKAGIQPVLAVVLLGQEELATILARHSNREIGARVKLIQPPPLSIVDGEVRAFIHHLCAVATLDRAPVDAAERDEVPIPFNNSSLDAIEQELGGDVRPDLLTVQSLASHTLYEAHSIHADAADADCVRSARAKLTQGVF